MAVVSRKRLYALETNRDQTIFDRQYFLFENLKTTRRNTSYSDGNTYTSFIYFPENGSDGTGGASVLETDRIFRRDEFRTDRS